MNPIFTCLPTLAVSMLFCCWDHYKQYRAEKHQKTLRERVTWMLWEAAKRAA